ncbi:MAG: sensor histidine kinase [Lachnospiraceae bacterium]
MTKEENNPLNIIEEANSKTLDYFNKTYVENLELVQNLKTELFELEVQIDTLEKTRDLYTYDVDDRRNVFSPFTSNTDPSSTKGHQLALQIKDLEDAKERLIKRIETIEKDIEFYKEQVAMLSKAGKCIHTVLIGSNHEASDSPEASEELIEFIETENKDEKITHPYTMMMLEDYENHKLSTSLDQNVKQELISNLNKLDVLKWLLHSDIGRAQVTLNELHTSQQSILESIDDILYRLNYNIDTKQPIWDQVNKLVDNYRQSHPECMIDSTCDCTEHDIELPSVITIRLIQMLREVFDNIFKHSNANHITSKIFISSRLIDVYVNDNGVGIPEDYLDRASYSSGLHKLHETIYQLDGNIQIQGDLISGTNVRFSFPIKK